MTASGTVNVILLVAALVVAVYLLVALVFPERF
ncbi:potassium-transporting ATPase subunit F [Williamsia herbipolensis]|uniref:Potassium-transporting ATPase subunit F n=1 Tax=Williamsia herbipolensis TaxID=1603258 RepID=A0AAU4K320_9NOCA|nr:potassium-transporting ATPase subunit F [Williamsia herbipolensis]MCX6471446.1 potassium-transporting ATPase subunit F [Mycobacteriales bacterium]